MEIQVAESKVNLHDVQVAEAVSLHTGRALQVIQGNATLPGEGAKHFEGVATCSAPNGEGQVVPFSLRVTSSYYTQGSGRTHYALVLEEREVIVAERLSIGPLDLAPTAYKEEADDGALIIEVHATLTSEETDRLLLMAAAREFYPVVRHGVSSDERQMRFGVTFWQAQEGNQVLHQFVLVEEPYDQVVRQDITRARSANRDKMVLVHEGVLRRLIEALTASGVLETTQADALWAEALEGRQMTQIREWCRVGDFSEWKPLVDPEGD